MLSLLGYIDLRYADETAFTLQPNVPYGWILEGKQRGIVSRKGGNINVFGLLNILGELTTYQSLKSVNSQTVIEWLDDFIKTLKNLTVIVIDNAPWHISKAVKNKLEAWEMQGLFVFYLPPYSPHLNLIEVLWRKMKNTWLKAEDYRSKEDLHEAVNNILKNYNQGEYQIEFKAKLKCYNNYV